MRRLRPHHASGGLTRVAAFIYHTPRRETMVMPALISPASHGPSDTFSVAGGRRGRYVCVRCGVWGRAGGQAGAPPRRGGTATRAGGAGDARPVGARRRRDVRDPGRARPGAVHGVAGVDHLSPVEPVFASGTRRGRARPSSSTPPPNDRRPTTPATSAVSTTASGRPTPRPPPGAARCTGSSSPTSIRIGTSGSSGYATSVPNMPTRRRRRRTTAATVGRA